MARGRLRAGEGALLARWLGVSERTLRSWRGRAGARPPGRPGHGPEQRAHARERVQVALELPGTRQSWRGAREKLAELGERLPSRLVQESTRLIKAQRAQRARVHRQAHCTRAEVLEPGTLWSADTTDLGRSAEGTKCEGSAVKDVCTREVLAASLGEPVDGAGWVQFVASACAHAGRRPLVLASDNGGPQRSGAIQRWAEEQQIVLLYSVPRVPQHNAWIERSFGELKAEAGLGGVEPLLWPVEPVLTRAERRAMPWRHLCAELGRRVERARWRLNTELQRPCLGGKTSVALDRLGTCADDPKRRARFYADCQAAIAAAAQGLESGRARRRAEREAIWCTMERHGLVKRTRGGRPLQTSNSAGIP